MEVGVPVLVGVGVEVKVQVKPPDIQTVLVAVKVAVGAGGGGGVVGVLLLVQERTIIPIPKNRGMKILKDFFTVLPPNQN